MSDRYKNHSVVILYLTLAGMELILYVTPPMSRLALPHYHICYISSTEERSANKLLAVHETHAQSVHR